MPSLYRVPPENPIKFIFLMLQIKKTKAQIRTHDTAWGKVVFLVAVFGFIFISLLNWKRAFPLWCFFLSLLMLFVLLPRLHLLKAKKMDKFYYNCYKITSQYHLPKASQKLLASSGILPCLLCLSFVLRLPQATFQIRTSSHLCPTGFPISPGTKPVTPGFPRLKGLKWVLTVLKLRK